MAVVVTCKSGDDLEYVWVNQPEGEAARDEHGYYIDAADAEAPAGGGSDPVRVRPWA